MHRMSLHAKFSLRYFAGKLQSRDLRDPRTKVLAQYSAAIIAEMSRLF